MFFYYFKIVYEIINYDLKKTPKDVIDFAIFHFNQGKEKDAVSTELSKKGWHKKEHQDMVFKAIHTESELIHLARSG